MFLTWVLKIIYIYIYVDKLIYKVILFCNKVILFCTQQGWSIQAKHVDAFSGETHTLSGLNIQISNTDYFKVYCAWDLGFWLWNPLSKRQYLVNVVLFETNDLKRYQMTVKRKSNFYVGFINAYKYTGIVSVCVDWQGSTAYDDGPPWRLCWHHSMRYCHQLVHYRSLDHRPGKVRHH